MTATISANATEVTVPDIGDFTDVPVIEVHVSPGDLVNADDPLLTLESDKATMEVPAPSAGTVVEVLVSEGDTVSQGSPIMKITAGDGAVVTPPSLVEQQEPAPAAPQPVSNGGPVTAHVHAAQARGEDIPAAAGLPERGGAAAGAGAHAGPSVRRTARELGIDLAAVTPTGPKGRITK